MAKIVSTAWLIIQPVRRGMDGRVVAVELDRMVKNKPAKLGVRDLAIKVNLHVDDALFTVPEPEIDIHLNDKRALVDVSAEVDVPEQEPT